MQYNEYWLWYQVLRGIKQFPVSLHHLLHLGDRASIQVELELLQAFGP
jgi:hypothetical protein